MLSCKIYFRLLLLFNIDIASKLKFVIYKINKIARDRGRGFVSNSCECLRLCIKAKIDGAQSHVSTIDASFFHHIFFSMMPLRLIDNICRANTCRLVTCVYCGPHVTSQVRRPLASLPPPPFLSFFSSLSFFFYCFFWRRLEISLVTCPI